MKEQPLQIVEDYLVLVRSHLPPSTAEDVIDELRDYIVDAATELGEGVVTVKSAKRAVARMGAPSEVAAEYAASLVTEGEPRVAGAPVTDKLEFLHETEGLREVGGGVTLQPTEGRESIPVEPTTYKSAIARVLLVLGLLSFVISLTIIGAELVLLELPAAMAILGVRLVQLYRRRDSLMRVSYNNPVKRLLSVPRKLGLFVTRPMILLDLSLTMGFSALLFGGFVLGGLERFSGGIACSLLFVRTVVVVLRCERSEFHPLAVMRIQFFLQVATAMILNVTAQISIFYYYWYAIGYSLTPILSTIAVVAAVYMLALSTMQIDYLWGVPAQDKSVMSRQEADYCTVTTAPASSPGTVVKKSAEPTDTVGTGSARRLVSVFFSWLFWMFYSLALLPMGLAALGGTASWPAQRTAMVWVILSNTSLLVFLVMSPIVIYLAARWAFLRRERSKVLIGFRSRPEAVVDCITTTLLIVLVLYACFSLPFQFQLWALAADYSTLFRYWLLVAVCVLLVSGLVVRLASDILNAVNRDSTLASAALRVSCLLILTGIGGFLGEAVLTDPYYGLSSYFMASLWSVPPAGFLSIQAVTSKTKFRRIPTSEHVDSTPPQILSGLPWGVASGIADLHLLRRKTVTLALVWPSILFFMTLFVVDVIVLAHYPAWEAAIAISIFNTGLVGALTMVYFGARRAMIYAAEAERVIGGRGRIEAALDLVLILPAFILVSYCSNALYSGLHDSPVAIDTGLAYLFQMTFWWVIAVGALLRAAADVAFIVSRGRVIPRTVFLISGVFLLGGIAFVIPLHLAILDLSWTALWLAAAALLNLQVVTSLAALDELSLQRTPNVTRERQNDGYPPGMAIPIN